VVAEPSAPAPEAAPLRGPIRHVAEEPAAAAAVTTLARQQDLPEASRASTEITKLSEHAWQLTARFPLHVASLPLARTERPARRLASLSAPSKRDVDALLAPAYAAYSTELSSTLGNLGRATLDVADGALVFAAAFPTEALAAEAGARVARTIERVPPTELRTATGQERVYYALPAAMTVRD
jgi:hypothetical protein